MKKLRIYDTQFAHGTALGSGDLKIYPTEFVWTRNNDGNCKDVCVFTESCFDQVKSVRAAHKVGLIIEPISISPDPYSKMRNPIYYKDFDFIFTHNQALINSAPHKFVYYPFMGCWIELGERMIYPKSKNVSIVASDKRNTAGHNLRHAAIAKYRNQLQGVYGRGYNFIQSKMESLKDFRFQIVIENEKSHHWFTEKLCDCFVTGTIPIYCGTDSIGQFYNVDGMMTFNTVEELGEILKNCNEEEYNKRLDAVKDNFERASKYNSLPDNYIFEHLKKQFDL